MLDHFGFHGLFIGVLNPGSQTVAGFITEKLSVNGYVAAELFAINRIRMRQRAQNSA
jgi:hypothetical protein